jgi:ankyrin repeat protein
MTPPPPNIVGHMTLPQLKTLLAQGVDANARGADGMTPLIFFLRSTYADKKDYIEALLQAKADPNAADDAGRTPLHWLGISHGGLDRDAEIGRLLLDAGAKLDARDENGATPLHSATRAWLGSNKPNIVMFLIGEGADIHAKNHAGATPLQIAVDARRTETDKRNVTEFFNGLAAKGNAADTRQKASAATARKNLKDNAGRAPKLRK